MKNIFAIITILMAFVGSLCLCVVPACAQIVSGNVYTLTCKTSGMNLDNEGSSTATNGVWQWARGLGATNQQWQINSLGNGEYTLICVTSGMALDNGGSTSNGADVTQYYPNGNTNQQWSITSVGGGYYQLICKTSGMALDNSGSTSNGGTVWQWSPGAGNTNQEWLIAPVQIGANTPYTSYEAESGTRGGGATVVSLTSHPTTEFSSPQLEASGHAYVNLGATGQSVTWTNNTGKSITAINVRYSIPDAIGGGGITSTLDLYVNGTLRQALPVDSKQTWCYESTSWYDGMGKVPGSGLYPHVFWDEVHAFISGAAIAPGSTIMLKKDSANSASYYNIDVADLEAPPAALTQPANSLSITSYGAVANNSSVDSTTAIQNCINAAQSSNMIVWIPQGTFYINSTAPLYATGVTIEGAGMWYSTIYKNVPLPSTSVGMDLLPTSCTIENLSIDGNAVDLSATGGDNYGINMKGNNWVINSVWIQHEGPGIWADGTNGTVENCRLNNTWADGININNGSGATGNNTGNYITVVNNHIRGSGDDGLAINDQVNPPSGGNPGNSEMMSPTVVGNTVVAPWWANNIGIYGGSGDVVANNLCTDSVKEFGISIGLYGYSATLVNAEIQGNSILRGGSFGYGIQYPGIGVGVTDTASTNTGTMVRGNTIVNPMFDGMRIWSGSGMSIDNNTINGPLLDGIDIDSSANGSAYFVEDTILNLQTGETAFNDNASSSNFAVNGTVNNGFTVP